MQSQIGPEYQPGMQISVKIEFSTHVPVKTLRLTYRNTDDPGNSFMLEEHFDPSEQGTGDGAHEMDACLVRTVSPEDPPGFYHYEEIELVTFTGRSISYDGQVSGPRGELASRFHIIPEKEHAPFGVTLTWY